MEELPQKPAKTPFLRLFAEMFLISACTFGGGFVIVSLMKKKFVEKYRWMSAEQMLDMTAIAQSSPGAIAVNASLQVGFYLGGGAGAAVAVLGTVLPPVVILSLISLAYAAFRDSVLVATLLQGMQLGVGAVLLDVTVGLAKPFFQKRDWFSLGIMAAAFVLAWVLKLNVMYIVLGVAALGVLRAVIAAKKSGGGRTE